VAHECRLAKMIAKDPKERETAMGLLEYEWCVAG
jgi:hypothetical protein